MQNFKTVLNKIDNLIYMPNQMTVDFIIEEQQNADYAAGRFTLNFKLADRQVADICTTRTVRFRVAKTTPTKIGQFVTFWEKDTDIINQPYHIDNALDLLVITVFNKELEFGQFVFPKAILISKNILKSHKTKGKMEVRVYPS